MQHNLGLLGRRERRLQKAKDHHPEVGRGCLQSFGENLRRCPKEGTSEEAAVVKTNPLPIVAAQNQITVVLILTTVVLILTRSRAMATQSRRTRTSRRKVRTGPRRRTAPPRKARTGRSGPGTHA